MFRQTALQRDTRTSLELLLRNLQRRSQLIKGALKAETYEKDGATHLSLSVVADQVLALRQPRRAKKGNP